LTIFFSGLYDFGVNITILPQNIAIYILASASILRQLEVSKNIDSFSKYLQIQLVVCDKVDKFFSNYRVK
jgi:hypothetical protein